MPKPAQPFSAPWRGRSALLAAIMTGWICTSGVQAEDPPPSADELLKSVEQWAKENLDENVVKSLGQVDRNRVQKGLTQLEQRLRGNSVYDLGALRKNAVALLPLLQQFEGTAPLAQWLQTRVDYLEAAEEFKREAQPTGPKPGTPPPPPTLQRQRTFWNKRMEKRALPPLAQNYVPQLKPIFAAQKVPSQMVWLAEIESDFNPDARSPAGAEGMFQLMKPTAKRFGLSTFLPDDRRNPEKSARAAATYLGLLHKRYGDWRLALAAYNAGEGRVDATMKKAGSRRYEDIINRLPAETQMYVPRYEATLKKREGLTLAELKIPNT